MPRLGEFNYKIDEEFVPFEIAKMLKESNFTIPCLAWYNNETGEFNMLGQETDHIHTTFFTPEITQAPLWSQVIRWLKIEHRLHLSTQQEIYWGHPHEIEDNDVPRFTGSWIYALEWIGKYERDGFPLNEESFKTEYSALVAGLLICLNIIKNGRV